MAIKTQKLKCVATALLPLLLSWGCIPDGETMAPEDAANQVETAGMKVEQGKSSSADASALIEEDLSGTHFLSQKQVTFSRDAQFLGYFDFTLKSAPVAGQSIKVDVNVYSGITHNPWEFRIKNHFTGNYDLLGNASRSDVILTWDFLEFTLPAADQYVAADGGVVIQLASLEGAPLSIDFMGVEYAD